VNEYLEGLGYLTGSFAYHDVMPLPIKNRLQYLFTFTSLYIRGRADRVAVHKSSNDVFEYEVKTHNKKGNDLLIELLPFLHHLNKSRLGVRCLYIFNVQNQQGGFWIDKYPPIRIVMIPSNDHWHDLQNELYKMSVGILPDIKIVKVGEVNGSGDPFLIIDKVEIAKLPHWKEIILQVGEERVQR